MDRYLRASSSVSRRITLWISFIREKVQIFKDLNSIAPVVRWNPLAGKKNASNLPFRVSNQAKTLFSIWEKCSITPFVQAFGNSNESNCFWRENLAPWLNEKMAKKIKRKRKNVACCPPKCCVLGSTSFFEACVHFYSLFANWKLKPRDCA